MNRVMQAKNKVTLLLLSAILLLCIGFIFIACGVGPTTKANNPDRGNFAVDFTDCPSSSCLLSASASEVSYAANPIETKPLTIEAWIKPKSTSTSYMLKHLEARGIALKTVAFQNATCDGATPKVFTTIDPHQAVLGQPLVPAATVVNCNVTAGTPYYVCSIPTNKTYTIGTSVSCAALVGGAGVAAVDWGSATTVSPMLEIRRVVDLTASVGTSSVSYMVAGTPLILNAAWTHVAGQLVNNPGAAAQTAHAAVHTAAGVPCLGTPGNNGASASPSVPAGAIAADADATNDPWHMDLYLNGTLTACGHTYGQKTLGGTDPDTTTAATAYAHTPGAKVIGVTAAGIIDETRIWTTDQRTISTCMGAPLSGTGDCSPTDPSLLSYMKFNAGDGHFVADYARIFGTGGKEYPLGNDVFEKWNTGWTTDTPF